MDDGCVFVHDASNRLRQIKTFGGSPVVVTDYRYNGLGFRTGWHYDANGSGTVDSSDPWYYFCDDEAWRLVATLRGSDARLRAPFRYPCAGQRSWDQPDRLPTG